MAKVNRTRYAVLGMLSFRPMSGYEMKKYIDNSIIHFWQENFGRIYPVLRSLEREGLATKQVDQEEGRPVRHVYSITEKGRRELARWLLLPAERPNWRIELLLKLFFGSQVSVANMIRKVRSEKAFCRHTLETFQQLEDHIKSHESGTEIPYGLITLSYGQHYYRAVEAWCDETLERLRRFEGEGEPARSNGFGKQ